MEQGREESPNALDMKGHRQTLPPVWHSVERGLSFISFSLPALLGLFALNAAMLLELRHEWNLALFFLVMFSATGLMYLAGTIQCALVPDHYARGLMLAVSVGGGVQLLLEFIQVNRTFFAGTLIHQTRELVVGVHGLIAVGSVVLWLLFLRRLAVIFANADLADGARGLIVLLLGWGAAVSGVIATNVIVVRQHVGGTLEGMLAGINQYALVASLLIAVVYLGWFFSVLTIARNAILQALSEPRA